MAGLCWMAVTLGLLLSVGNSSATFERPNQNQLTEIVNELLNRYRPSYTKKETGNECFPMFSLAVSIPYNNNKKMYDISLVTDDAQVLKNTILGCEVYRGTRVVAATVLRWPNVLDQCRDGRVQWADVLRKCKRASMTWAEVERDCPTAVEGVDADHAEYRTLTAFNTLTNSRNENDFMLFYVLSSPCSQICTNETHERSILKSIEEIKKWKNHAVVFSDVFKPRGGDDIPEKDLREALERLGGSIGLNNIFRCKARRSAPCTSCSSGGQVTPYCYNAKSGPSNNLPSTSSILPPRGRRDSPSQSGQGERDQKNNDINTSAGDSTNVDGNSGRMVFGPFLTPVPPGSRGGQGRRWRHFSPPLPPGKGGRIVCERGGGGRIVCERGMGGGQG